jgi:hypothetical protein
LGVGKTELALQLSGKYLHHERYARVVYHVANMRLGRELETRARELYRRLGFDVPVQLYLGNDQPDPDAPEFNMCRINEEMREVLKAYGTMSVLCGSHKRGFCPHFRECGRNRIQVIQHGLLIIAGPEGLIRAAPAGLKRRGQPVADIIIVDEPRPLDWIDSTTCEIDAKKLRPFSESDTAGGNAVAAVKGALTALEDLVEGLPAGPLKREEVIRLSWLRDWGEIRRTVFSLMVDPSHHVGPATPAAERADMLKEIGKHNARVMGVVRLTHVIEAAASAMWTVVGSENVLHPDGRKSVRITWHDFAGLIEVNYDDTLRLRWRGVIAKDWRHSPLLLLDASADIWVLQQWWHDLTVIAEGRVAEPDCVWRLQTWDSELPFSTWVPKDKEPPAADNQDKSARNERSRWGNAQQVMHLLEVLCHESCGKGRDGIDVVAIMPKRLEGGCQPPVRKAGRHAGRAGHRALQRHSWGQPLSPRAMPGHDFPAYADASRPGGNRLDVDRCSRQLCRGPEGNLHRRSIRTARRNRAYRDRSHDAASRPDGAACDPPAGRCGTAAGTRPRPYYPADSRQSSRHPGPVFPTTPVRGERAPNDEGNLRRRASGTAFGRERRHAGAELSRGDGVPGRRDADHPRGDG